MKKSTKSNHANLKFKVAILNFENDELQPAVAQLNAAVAKLNVA